MRMCSNEKNIINKLEEGLNLLTDNNPVNYASYMTWSKFLSLFPKIYELVYFDGNSWYWNEGIEIKLFYNGHIPDDYILFYDLERINKYAKN